MSSHARKYLHELRPGDCFTFTRLTDDDLDGELNVLLWTHMPDRPWTHVHRSVGFFSGDSIKTMTPIALVPVWLLDDE